MVNKKNGFPNSLPTGKISSSKSILVVVETVIDGKLMYQLCYKGTTNIYTGEGAGPFENKLQASLSCGRLNFKLGK